jgi:N-formylglutamate deformylase
MEFACFNLPVPDLVIATAIHDGHDLRPDLAGLVNVDDATRLREEDPHTGTIAKRFTSSVVVHRSRFEVDLNREREEAVYRGPDDAWGLDLWRRPPTEEVVSESLMLYDRFYSDLASALDRLVAERGGFVLYDIHSYNHRRAGPEAPPDPVEESPVVNLGTGSLPGRWKGVAGAFVESLRGSNLAGAPIDVGENVQFEGRQVARWVHENYGDVGCALAIELKKVFMDEWTGMTHSTQVEELGDALLASVEPVERAWDLA